MCQLDTYAQPLQYVCGTDAHCTNCVTESSIKIGDFTCRYELVGRKSNLHFPVRWWWWRDQVDQMPRRKARPSAGEKKGSNVGRYPPWELHPRRGTSPPNKSPAPKFLYSFPTCRTPLWIRQSEIIKHHEKQRCQNPLRADYRWVGQQTTFKLTQIARNTFSSSLLTRLPTLRKWKREIIVICCSKNDNTPQKWFFSTNEIVFCNFTFCNFCFRCNTTTYRLINFNLDRRQLWARPAFVNLTLTGSWEWQFTRGVGLQPWKCAHCPVPTPVPSPALAATRCAKLRQY